MTRSGADRRALYPRGRRRISMDHFPRGIPHLSGQRLHSSTIRAPPPGWCAWNWRARPFTMNRGWMRAGCTTRYATGRGSRGSNIRIPLFRWAACAGYAALCGVLIAVYDAWNPSKSRAVCAGCTVAPADASPGRMNNPFTPSCLHAEFPFDLRNGIIDQSRLARRVQYGTSQASSSLQNGRSAVGEMRSFQADFLAISAMNVSYAMRLALRLNSDWVRRSTSSSKNALALSSSSRAGMDLYPDGILAEGRDRQSGLVKMGRKLLDDGEIRGSRSSITGSSRCWEGMGGLPVGPQPFKNDALPRGLGMHQHQAFRRLEQGELLVQSPQILEICGKILFHPPFRAWRGIRTGTRLLRKIQPPLGGRHLFQGNGPDGKDRRWSRSTLGAFRGRGKHWEF